MGGIKKYIVVSFYLVTVLSLGISSLLIGRRVADQQRKIIPSEAEAEEADCLKCCWEENCDPGGPEFCYGDEIDQRSGCKSCRMQRDKDCDKDGYWWSEGCDSRECPSEPTATPTPIPTSTPIPTPTPLPGCWGVCTVDTNCPQNTTPPLVCPGGRCVNPNCPTEQDCTCPSLLCLGLTATPSAQILKKGDDVEFACKGSYGTGSINHVEFRIQVNDGAWQNLGTAPVTQVSGEYQGVKSYKVPDAGNYRVECRACTSTDETACTNWGLAQ